MSRLTRSIRSAAKRDEIALGMFLTSGFPHPDDTLDVLRAIDEGGADFVELGMPFSDPLAEGLPIQRSSEAALRHGITMRDTLSIAANFTEQSETPLLLMGYVNPVLRFGISNFFDAARSSRVDGVILPDVPPEEAKPFIEAARASGIDMIMLISPTTPDERVRRIDELSSGFVYAVSVTGITGTSLGDADPISRYLGRVKSLVTSNPLMVGFGIRTREDVENIGRYADGCIVGSALIQRVESLFSDESLTRTERLHAVKDFVRDLKFGT